jgi:hypothetical protein
MMQTVIALGVVMALAQSLQFPLPGVRHMNALPRWNQAVKSKGNHGMFFKPMHLTGIRSTNQGNAPEDDTPGISGEKLH